jgi:hypothetical protein
MDGRENSQSKAPTDGESRTLIAFFGRRPARVLAVVALLLFTLFSLTGTARAQTVVRGESVPGPRSSRMRCSAGMTCRSTAG